jgi:REP element-mobilizing transposase RayT
MSNHIHLIWQALPGETPAQIQYSFMKFTAQQIKFDLEEEQFKFRGRIDMGCASFTATL